MEVSRREGIEEELEGIDDFVGWTEGDAVIEILRRECVWGDGGETRDDGVDAECEKDGR